MNALTIHQPWAWAIADGHKDVENRTWRPPSRIIGQRIGIHAGQKTDPYARIVCNEVGLEPPWPEQPVIGALLGTVRVVGAVRNSISLWAAEGQWHWELEDAVALETPVPCSGSRRIWELDSVVTDWFHRGAPKASIAEQLLIEVGEVERMIKKETRCRERSGAR